MLESDFERAKAYVEVKNIIDDFHRSFIEDVLSKETLGLDWGALYDQFDLFQSEKDKVKKAKHKKQLEVLQSVMRPAASRDPTPPSLPPSAPDPYLQ